MAWELLPSPTRPPRAQAPATTAPSLRCAGIFGPHPAGSRSGVQDHQLGFIGSAPVRPACSKQHAPARVLRSLSGDDPPVRFIDPAPGRPATPTLSLRCAGFCGPQPAGPAREFKLQARVHRCHPGPARLLKVTLSARVLRPAPGDGPFSQVHRPRTGPACNHCSPLRRVLRSSTGRPRSEARLTSSGSSGPPWVRPACSSDSGWSGFHGPASGDGPASTSRQVH